MAPSRDGELLQHMVEVLDLIQEWAADGYEVFASDTRTQFAILRGMHTVTESATFLSDELKGRHPSIPWREIAGYRAIVVHGYMDRHSLELAWEYIEADLPGLRQMVESELASEAGKT